MELNLFEILTYFIIYSFLGWVMESLFRSICERKIINTGFLQGPFCPIYGFGSVIMFIFLGELKDNPIILFLVAIIVLTIWEYIGGVILEKLFHTKYWDYSNHKFNFQGRICLTNSIYWGILGVIFIEFIHPFMQKMISNIDKGLLKYIICILAIALLIDMIATSIKVKNIKTTLEKVEQLNKEIREKLKEIRKIKKNKEKSTSIENIQIMVEQLKKKRNKTVLRLYKNVYRLKKAFPAINTKEITEVLSKKIEIRKKHKKQ